jgi:hypothetical protein
MRAVVDVAGTTERLIDVAADVGVADVSMKIGPGNELGRLVPRPAQDQVSARLMQRLSQVFEGTQPGRVDGGHVAESEDHDLRMFST